MAAAPAGNSSWYGLDALNHGAAFIQIPVLAAIFCQDLLEECEIFWPIVVKRTDALMNRKLSVTPAGRRILTLPIAYPTRACFGGIVVSSGVCSRLAVLRQTAMELVSLLAQLQRLREQVRRAEGRSLGDSARLGPASRMRRRRFGTSCRTRIQ